MKTAQIMFMGSVALRPLKAAANEADFGVLREPDPIAFAFETPGWYLLLALVLLLAAIAIVRKIRKHLKNRFLRAALHELDAVSLSKMNVTNVFAILKRVAIRLFGREEVAALHGMEWLSYLDKTGRKVNFRGLEAPVSAALYEGKEPERMEKKRIMRNAKQWILTHAR